MKANYMTSRWRIPTAFVAAALVLVATALVLEHLEAVDPSAASYGCGAEQLALQVAHNRGPSSQPWEQGGGAMGEAMGSKAPISAQSSH